MSEKSETTKIQNQLRGRGSPCSKSERLRAFARFHSTAELCVMCLPDEVLMQAWEP